MIDRFDESLLIDITNIYIFPDRNDDDAIAKIKKLEFTLSNSLKIINRSPVSLVDALSRLGGILAFVNFRYLI
jgi:hypothetical protein